MPYYIKDFPNQTISTSGASAASSGITLLDDVTAYGCFTSGAVTTSAFIVQVEPTTTGSAWVDLKTGTGNVLLLTSGCTILTINVLGQITV